MEEEEEEEDVVVVKCPVVDTVVMVEGMEPVVTLLVVMVDMVMEDMDMVAVMVAVMGKDPRHIEGMCL